MGILKDIHDTLTKFKEKNRRKPTLADYKRIIYQTHSGGKVSYDSVISDLIELRQDIAPNPPALGEFIFFKYTPRFARKLHIYDVFPLVAVTDLISGKPDLMSGEPPRRTNPKFGGINLHYISKSAAGGIVSRQYAFNTFLEERDATFDFSDGEDISTFENEIYSFLNKKNNSGLLKYKNSSLYHLYILSLVEGNIYIVPDHYAQIMMFLDLEHFIVDTPLKKPRVLKTPIQKKLHSAEKAKERKRNANRRNTNKRKRK